MMEKPPEQRRVDEEMRILKVLGPIVVIIALAIGGLFFVKSKMGPHAGDSTESAPAGSVDVGSTIPDFELTAIEGKSSKFL